MAKRRSKKYGVIILFGLAVAAIGVGCVVTNDSAQECPPGMVAYWKFDEGSGNTAHDSIGTNHGTIYEATWTTGQVGGALNFDNVNAYVDIPQSASLDLTQTMTFEAWIKAKDISRGHYHWP